MPKIVFRVHAIQKMFERNIGHVDVKAVIEQGEVIRDYPDDKPYPSRLMLGWRGERPIHIVVANDPSNDEIIIITAYEPDPAIWEADFKRKKATKS